MVESSIRERVGFVRISSRAHYAVRAMLDLALHGQNRPIPIQQIANRQRISAAYLEQLFGRLRRGLLIQSVRGVRGGYLLARPAHQVTVAEILEQVGEPLDLVACLDCAAQCEQMDGCLSRQLWQHLGGQIRRVLDQFTLQHLLDGVNPCDTEPEPISHKSSAGTGEKPIHDRPCP